MLHIEQIRGNLGALLLEAGRAQEAVDEFNLALKSVREGTWAGDMGGGHGGHGHICVGSMAVEHQILWPYPHFPLPSILLI